MHFVEKQSFQLKTRVSKLYACLQVESLFQWSDVFSSVCQGSNAFSVLHKKMVTLIAGAASIVYSKVDMNLIKNGQK